jgi:uncharacterized protein (TIGR03663 family)
MPPESHSGTARGGDADRATGPLVPADRVTVAVVALGVGAMVARLVALGDRPFHWDEARVGYWTLRFLETGAFQYRPVAGGPLLYVVNRHLLSVLPVADWSARAVVAVVGGLLPLAALLFRGRLRDGETVALSLLLAANPVLLYYSRFLRGDVLLGTFGLLATGAAVRFHDTRERRYLYLLAAAVTLALASSGFVAGYLLCWAVAGWLVFDHAALVSSERPRGIDVDDAREAATRWATPLARAFLLAAALFLFAFAPRAGPGGGPDLTTLSTLPGVLAESMGAVEKFYGVRIATRRFGGTHPLIPYVRDLVGVLLAGGLATTLLAAYTFVRDRYAAGGPRRVVALHAYWGFVAVPVFAAVTEVNAPWVAVHVLVPLSVPAAVGLAHVGRALGGAYARGDAASVGAVLLLVLAGASQAGVVVADDVYGPSEPTSSLVHYAQPADDLDGFAATVEAASRSDGVDVLYVGEEFYVARESRADAPPVPDAWGNRLPLAWYVERADAETASVRTPSDIDRRATPVVVAPAAQRGAVAQRLPTHNATTYRLALWNRKVVVFVRENAISGPPSDGESGGAVALRRGRNPARTDGPT